MSRALLQGTLILGDGTAGRTPHICCLRAHLPAMSPKPRREP